MLASELRPLRVSNKWLFNFLLLFMSCIPSPDTFWTWNLDVFKTSCRLNTLSKRFWLLASSFLISAENSTKRTQWDRRNDAYLQTTMFSPRARSLRIFCFLISNSFSFSANILCSRWSAASCWAWLLFLRESSRLAEKIKEQVCLISMRRTSRRRGERTKTKIHYNNQHFHHLRKFSI